MLYQWIQPLLAKVQGLFYKPSLVPIRIESQHQLIAKRRQLAIKQKRLANQDWY